MTEDHPRQIRAAAIQLEAEVGDVATNLARIERLVSDAASDGARLIAVPEFCTSRLPMDARAHQAVLPPDNPALALFRRLAARHRCWIGGSMLIADGGEIYNRYHFVEPDGSLHCHDKDLPTMWEGAFYAPGQDDGAFRTGLGGVGAAVCWELIRSGTVRRLRGRIDVAMTGTHWWTIPDNWGPATGALRALGRLNRRLSQQAPAEFARRLGVPVLQASHCGSFRGDFMLLPGLAASLPYDSEFVGCTQIVDADGTVLARRDTREGPGIVSADITLGARTPLLPPGDDFWLPDLPLAMRAYWHQQNACGKSWYRRHGRAAGLAAAARHADSDTQTTHKNKGDTP